MVGKTSPGDRIFDIINVALLVLLTLLFVFPFYLVLVNSFTAEKFLTSGSVSLWPREWSVTAYSTLFMANSRLTSAFFTSMAATVLGTIQGMVVITLFGYAMAKERFPGKRLIMVLIIFSMMFSGGLIPTFLLFQQLHLNNTFYVLTIFNAFAAGNMIFIRNYFMSVPPALSESARLDGAGEFQVFLKIMIPLAKPMLACMTLFTAVAIYNDYQTPLFYNNRDTWVTLQLILKRILVKIDSLSTRGMMLSSKDVLPSNGIKAATVILVLAPILAVYPFVQKYFIAGVWTGAMKE